MASRSVIAVVGRRVDRWRPTLALNLAAALARQKPVVMLDADVRQSDYQWRVPADEKAGFPFVVSKGAGLEKWAAAVCLSYSHVIISLPSLAWQ